MRCAHLITFIRIHFHRSEFTLLRDNVLGKRSNVHFNRFFMEDMFFIFGFYSILLFLLEISLLYLQFTDYKGCKSLLIEIVEMAL
jgi:hypothetical protein